MLTRTIILLKIHLISLFDEKYQKVSDDMCTPGVNGLIEFSNVHIRLKLSHMAMNQSVSDGAASIAGPSSTSCTDCVLSHHCTHAVIRVLPEESKNRCQRVQLLSRVFSRGFRFTGTPSAPTTQTNRDSVE